MKIFFFSCCFSLLQLLSIAQFAPRAGQLGTTAIHKDSSVFVAWATGCSINTGYQDISNTSLGFASVGDSSMALGIAGSNGVVSLGDGGYAIVTFVDPVSNGVGWDFAVFENSFSDTYLELAYVEVSSDGINYFRFPCTSYTQDTVQVDGFGNVDATKIDNLAGKYRALYGTPFDLQQLSSQVGLDVNAVTHIKIIDVVGCIQNTYARYDQYGNKINDPWNTPFASGGFDLDAVGVIHNSTIGIKDIAAQINFNISPNPANELVSVHLNFDNAEKTKIILTDYTGKEVQILSAFQNNGLQNIQLNVRELKSGIYFISICTPTGVATKKLVISND